MELLHSELFIWRIAPIMLTYRLVHALCCSLCQSVGQQLHHHLLIGVVVKVFLQTHIDSSGKKTYTVLLRMYEISKTKTITTGLLLAKQGDTVSVSEHDIVALAMGINQQEQGMGTIATFQVGQHMLRLLL